MYSRFFQFATSQQEERRSSKTIPTPQHDWTCPAFAWICVQRRLLCDHMQVAIHCFSQVCSIQTRVPLVCSGSRAAWLSLAVCRWVNMGVDALGLLLARTNEE